MKLRYGAGWNARLCKVQFFQHILPLVAELQFPFCIVVTSEGIIFESRDQARNNKPRRLQRDLGGDVSVRAPCSVYDRDYQ